MLACARVGVRMPLSSTVFFFLFSDRPFLVSLRVERRQNGGNTYTYTQQSNNKTNVYRYVLSFSFSILILLLGCCCVCLRTCLLSFTVSTRALLFDSIFLFSFFVFCPSVRRPPPLVLSFFLWKYTQVLTSRHLAPSCVCCTPVSLSVSVVECGVIGRERSSCTHIRANCSPQNFV